MATEPHQPTQEDLYGSVYKETCRYSRIFETSYPILNEDDKANMYRLKNVCEASIYFLRKLAPKFYSTKLPALIHEVGDRLLMCDITTEEGQFRLKRTHDTFLAILSELRESQPMGKCTYDGELNRIRRQRLLLERVQNLEQEISDLRAKDFDYDQIGDDVQDDNDYAQTMANLELKVHELRRLYLELGFIKGDEFEEDIPFKLTVRPGSQLSRLTAAQLETIEFKLAELYRIHDKRKFLDKDIFDNLVERVIDDPTVYRKVDIQDMTVEAYSAFQKFRRDQDQKLNEHYHLELLANEKLLPIEGDILPTPDDIPDTVKYQLDQNDGLSLRNLDRIYSDYSAVPDAEASAWEEVSESEVSDDMEQLLNTIKTAGKQFARVKEEPVSDEEFEEDLLGELQDTADESNVQANSEPTDVNMSGVIDESNIDMARSSNTMDLGIQAEPMSILRPSANNNDSDDDIVCLGTVEPNDKVQMIDLD